MTATVIRCSSRSIKVQGPVRELPMAEYVWKMRGLEKVVRSDTGQ